MMWAVGALISPSEDGLCVLYVWSGFGFNLCTDGASHPSSGPNFSFTKVKNLIFIYQDFKDVTMK